MCESNSRHGGKQGVNFRGDPHAASWAAMIASISRSQTPALRHRLNRL